MSRFGNYSTKFFKYFATAKYVPKKEDEPKRVMMEEDISKIERKETSPQMNDNKVRFSSVAGSITKKPAVKENVDINRQTMVQMKGMWDPSCQNVNENKQEKAQMPFDTPQLLNEQHEDSQQFDFGFALPKKIEEENTIDMPKVETVPRETLTSYQPKEVEKEKDTSVPLTTNVESKQPAFANFSANPTLGGNTQTQTAPNFNLPFQTAAPVDFSKATIGNGENMFINYSIGGMTFTATQNNEESVETVEEQDIYEEPKVTFTEEPKQQLQPEPMDQPLNLPPVKIQKYSIPMKQEEPKQVETINKVTEEPKKEETNLFSGLSSFNWTTPTTQPEEKKEEPKPFSGFESIPAFTVPSSQPEEKKEETKPFEWSLKGFELPATQPEEKKEETPQFTFNIGSSDKTDEKKKDESSPFPNTNTFSFNFNTSGSDNNTTSPMGSLASFVSAFNFNSLNNSFGNQQEETAEDIEAESKDVAAQNYAICKLEEVEVDTSGHVELLKAESLMLAKMKKETGDDGKVTIQWEKLGTDCEMNVIEKKDEGIIHFMISTKSTGRTIANCKLMKDLIEIKERKIPARLTAEAILNCPVQTTDSNGANKYKIEIFIVKFKTRDEMLNAVEVINKHLK